MTQELMKRDIYYQDLQSSLGNNQLINEEPGDNDILLLQVQTKCNTLCILTRMWIPLR